MYCNKIFSRKDRLQIHKSKCEIIFEEDLQNFDKETLIEIKISEENNKEENYII